MQQMGVAECGVVFVMGLWVACVAPVGQACVRVIDESVWLCVLGLMRRRWFALVLW